MVRALLKVNTGGIRYEQVHANVPKAEKSKDTEFCGYEIHVEG
jgi:hypothetical protein